MQGERFDGVILDFNRLEGGKIQIANEVVDEEGYVIRKLYDKATNPPSQHAGTIRRKDGSINVTAVTRYGKNDDYNTVENVQNILGIHEYYGHGVKGIGSATFLEHRKAYLLQTKHRTYKKVSDSGIELIKNGL